MDTKARSSTLSKQITSLYMKQQSNDNTKTVAMEVGRGQGSTKVAVSDTRTC